MWSEPSRSLKHELLCNWKLGRCCRAPVLNHHLRTYLKFLLLFKGEDLLAWGTGNDIWHTKDRSGGPGNVTMVTPAHRTGKCGESKVYRSFRGGTKGRKTWVCELKLQWERRYRAGSGWMSRVWTIKHRAVRVKHHLQAQGPLSSMHETDHMDLPCWKRLRLVFIFISKTVSSSCCLTGLIRKVHACHSQPDNWSGRPLFWEFSSWVHMPVFVACVCEWHE